MVGTALRRELEERQTPFVQLVRGEVTSARQLRWDPARIPPIADFEPLEGLSAAIHLSGENLGEYRWTPEYKRAICESRVESTRALATMLASLSKPPQVFIVASAVGIYGDRGNELLDERSSTGTGFLADVCREWEAAAEPAIQIGIRVVNARFGVVLSPGNGALGKMLPLFRLGLGGRLGSGQQWMSWISLQDLVSAILFLLDTPEPDKPELAGAVNFTAPAPVTNAEFTRALAAAVHRPAILPVPAFALRLALGEMADEALLASARAIPRLLTSAGFRFAHPTIDDALRTLLSGRR